MFSIASLHRPADVHGFDSFRFVFAPGGPAPGGGLLLRPADLVVGVAREAEHPDVGRVVTYLGGSLGHRVLQGLVDEELHPL